MTREKEPKSLRWIGRVKFAFLIIITFICKKWKLNDQIPFSYLGYLRVTKMMRSLFYVFRSILIVINYTGHYRLSSCMLVIALSAMLIMISINIFSADNVAAQ